MQEKKNNKKRIALIVLVVLLIITIVGGTVAWLTRTDRLNNKFTVGSFEKPTTDPTDPTKTISIDGNLYEPSWDSEAEHKLLPGISFDKDPYVGIGKGSEDAAVYVYVENNFSNKVYFTMNTGWEAVEATAGAKADTYTSGLFKYTAGLSNAADADVWTSAPLFSKVVVADDANISDFTVAAGKDKEIIVSSFLHQAKDDEGNDIDATEILTAAKKAFGIN